MKNLKFHLFLALIVTIVFSSCEKNDPATEDDKTEEENETEEGTKSSKYVVSLRIQASADETADYLLFADDLMTGEISAEGRGEELVGWNYVGYFGGTYFAIGYTLNECIGYKDIDSSLVEQGKMAFERMDMLTPIDSTTFLATGAPWGGGSYNCQFQFVNIENIGISKTINDPIYESYQYIDSTDSYKQLNAWPTFAYVEDDKMFVSFYPLDGVSWDTPNTDTAYVTVYSYPDMAYLKTMKDTRTSPIGYYSSQPCIIKDENGDHYTFSSSSYIAGFTQATKPSGVLRIKAGEDEFDKNYFFNVEEKGYKILSGAYVGNDKVVAKVVETTVDTIPAYSWGAFTITAPLLNIAILDLEEQTVTLVDEVPAHGGQYLTPMLVEDEMVYISVNNGAEAYVYQVDAGTATATKGAKIIGNELQTIILND